MYGEGIIQTPQWSPFWQDHKHLRAPPWAELGWSHEKGTIAQWQGECYSWQPPLPINAYGVCPDCCFPIPPGDLWEPLFLLRPKRRRIKKLPPTQAKVQPFPFQQELTQQREVIRMLRARDKSPNPNWYRSTVWYWQRPGCLCTSICTIHQSWFRSRDQRQSNHNELERTNHCWQSIVCCRFHCGRCYICDTNIARMDADTSSQ